MEGVADHFRAPGCVESDLERRVQLYALEGQFGRSQDDQLTFGQVFHRLVDGWWLGLCWVEGSIPLLPVRISRKVDSRPFDQPQDRSDPSLGRLVVMGA